jgi:hypothetical protein
MANRHAEPPGEVFPRSWADEELPYSYKNHTHNNNNDNDNKHAYAFNNTPARARVNSEQTKVMAEALHAPLPLMEAVFLCLI